MLTQFLASLERFAKATDSRNVYVSKNEIISCLDQCPLADKELLKDMAESFIKTKNKHAFVDWASVELVLFDKVKSCLDLYIGVKEEALEYLSEGVHSPKVMYHLMRKYQIKTREIRLARERVLV